MVNQEDLETLRAEHSALEAELKALRSSVVAARLAGDESVLAANERPRSPMAQVAILTREQKVLMASLRLGEELVALRNSNDVLFRRGQQLQEENASLKRENSILSAQAQCNTLSPSLGGGSHPAPKKKCSPEEKAERRELVAAVLKAGLQQDVHTISALRPNAVQPPAVPRIQLNQACYERSSSRGQEPSASELIADGARIRESSSPDVEARSRGRGPQSPSGARTRESSHSGAVAESKYLRELAIRDMLRGISQNTPRRTPRD